MPNPTRLRTAVRPALVAAALLASVLVAAPAYAFRLRGIFLSDYGPYAAAVMRLRQVGSSLVGTFRCIDGTGPCLLPRRYRVAMTFAANGSFTGSLTNRRTQCVVAGVLVYGGLEGRYGCLRIDGAADTGSFLVTR